MIEDKFIKMGFIEDIPNSSWKLHFPVSNITFLYIIHNHKVYYEYTTKGYHGDCGNQEMFVQGINKIIARERDLKLETIGI